MEVSPSPANPAPNGVSSPSFPAIDPNQLIDHLVAVIGSTLGATKEELESPGSLLHKSRIGDTIQRCSRFAADTQQSLYVQKDIAPSSPAEATPDESSMWSSLSLCHRDILA